MRCGTSSLSIDPAYRRLAQRSMRSSPGTLHSVLHRCTNAVQRCAAAVAFQNVTYTVARRLRPGSL